MSVAAIAIPKPEPPRKQGVHQQSEIPQVEGKQSESLYLFAGTKRPSSSDRDLLSAIVV